MSRFKKQTAIELFAGIGGFRLGLEASQIQTIWANDINELCCQVYQSNFGNAVVPICIEWICQRIGQKNITIKPKKYQQLTLFTYS